MTIIDLDTWKRKEHYNYFCGLDDPYWSMTTALDCTRTYWGAKHRGESFFLNYLHRSMQAANRVDEFKMRIADGQIICYEQVHASATVLRPDETFGCCFMEFCEDYADFAAKATASIEKTMATTGMCLEQDYKLDQIHISSIPWHHFTSLTYARSLKPQDSVPKITFGKMQETDGKMTFPVAIQVHHGLVDGLHVSRFLDIFQTLLMVG